MEARGKLKSLAGKESQGYNQFSPSAPSEAKDPAAAVKMKFGKSKEGYAIEAGVKACPRLDRCIIEETGMFSCDSSDR